MSRSEENTLRWQAWRKAVESGYARTESYDYFLHPRTRVSLTIVLEELGI